MPARAILLMVFLIASLPVCFIQPFYGILLWTVVAFLNPQSFIWNASDVFPWAVAVAIPTLAGFLILSRGWVNRLASRDIYLLTALWIWFVITSIASVHTPAFLHHAADTLARLTFVSKVMLMTVVAVAVVDSFARLRIFVWVIAGCFGFYVVKAFPFIIMTGGAFRLYGPEHTMIADNNDFGLALNMTLPMFFFLGQTEAKRWVRWLCRFLFLITIPAIFCTYSRGALVGLVAVIFLMFLQLKQRLALIPVIALAVLMAVLFAPDAWKERMDPTREDAVDASALSRFNAWTYSWHLVLEYPLAGGGFDTFTPELFETYAPNAKDIHGPHSVYLGVLAEHGFIGLLLYLSVVFSVFASMRSVVKEGRLQQDQRAIHYANMFRFSLLGFLTSGIFLGRAYFDYFFTILACAIILKRVCLSEWHGLGWSDVEQAA